MNEAQISEIVALAWDDETTFDAIERQFGLSEHEVIKLMRLNMKPSSFRMWRKRAIAGRKAKRGLLRRDDLTRKMVAEEGLEPRHARIIFIALTS